MAPELHPALLATGRFAVKRCLGAGSFGVVFEVHDRELAADVALKWLRHGDAATLARFKREFRSLADLVHPNLVGYRDLFSVGGEWFFTMDLVDGIDLLAYVRSLPAPGAAASTSEVVVRSTLGLGLGAANGGPMGPIVLSDTLERGNEPTLPSPRASTRAVTAGVAHPPLPRPPVARVDLGRVGSIVGQLGAGLDALHAAGMIHRDIKPSNVLVDRDGRVVILDLGLVTELGRDGVDVSKSGLVVGTPAYMSPEQAMGARLTPASDWYAVGVVLYVALTGQYPFDPDPRTLLVKKQLTDPSPPSSHVEEIPEALDALCLALLSRTPELRPMGRAFREQLESAVGTLPEPSVRQRGADSLAGASDRRPISNRTSVEPRSGAPALVGRGPHLARLSAALDDASGGATAIALVHGLSGMGKTALVRRFLEEVRSRSPDVLVFEGRCVERESVPYKSVDAVIDAIHRWLGRLPEAEATKLLPRDIEALARVFPVFGQLAIPKRRRSRTPIDGHEERRRAFEALRELLARIADRSTLVLFIDDLQWGDADSEPLFATLLRFPDPPPMLLIAGFRADDAENAPLVRALREVRPVADVLAVHEVAVEKLLPEDATALARTLLGARGDEKSAETLARESFGSPLFLHQLATFDRGDGPVDLGAAIAARVDALGGEARRLLDILAIAGRPLALPFAARLAGIERDAPGVATRLRSDTLVRTRGAEATGEVEVYHDRIREVVLARIEPERVKELHMALARDLAREEDPDVEAIATHFRLGEAVGLAAEYAEKAADRASEALAFERAAAMYEMAIDLASTSGQSAQTAESLLLKLAEALVSAGKNRAAAERFLDAAKRAISPASALDLRRRAAEQMLFSGQLAAGLDLIDQLLAEMKMGSPKSSFGIICSLLFRRFLLAIRGLRFRERTADELSRDRLVRIDTCHSLALGLGMVDPIRGADYQTRYLLLALGAGEPARIARGFALEAVYRASDGVRRQASVDALLARATALAQRVGDPSILGLIELVRAGTYVLLGDYRKCVAAGDRAATILREKCVGASFELDNVGLLVGIALLASGRIRELGRRIPEQLEDARLRGNLYGATILRVQCGWFLDIAKDDVDGARAALGTLSEEWVRDRAPLQRIWQAINSVNVALYAGLPEEAWTHASDAFARASAGGFTRAEGVRVLVVDARVRAALALAAAKPEERERLHRLAESGIARLRRERFPTALGAALLLDGVLGAARGDRQVALTRFREAIAELDDKGLVLHSLSARRRLGLLLATTDREGETLIAQADAEMKAEGMRVPEKIVRMFAP